MTMEDNTLEFVKDSIEFESVQLKNICESIDVLNKKHDACKSRLFAYNMTLEFMNHEKEEIDTYKLDQKNSEEK